MAQSTRTRAARAAAIDAPTVEAQYPTVDDQLPIEPVSADDAELAANEALWEAANAPDDAELAAASAPFEPTDYLYPVGENGLPHADTAPHSFDIAPFVLEVLQILHPELCARSWVEYQLRANEARA